MTGAEIRALLHLEPHPEGGFFRETYRAAETLPAAALPSRYAGHRPQVVVPAGTWQGARLAADEGAALLGCTAAPGFDFADFAAGARAELQRRWPAFAAVIAALTPD